MNRILFFLIAALILLQSHFSSAANGDCTGIFSENNSRQDSNSRINSVENLLPPPLQYGNSTTKIRSVYFIESNPASLISGAGSTQLFRLNFSNSGEILKIDTIMNHGPESNFSTIFRGSSSGQYLNMFGTKSEQGSLLGIESKGLIQVVTQNQVKVFEDIPFYVVDYDIYTKKNFAVLKGNTIVSFYHASGEIQKQIEAVDPVPIETYGQVKLYTTGPIGAIQLTNKHLIFDSNSTPRKTLKIEDSISKEIKNHLLKAGEINALDAVATESSYWVILSNVVKPEVSAKLEAMTLVHEMTFDSEGKSVPTKTEKVPANHRLAINITADGKVVGLQYIPYDYILLGSVKDDLIVWRAHDSALLKLGSNKSEFLLHVPISHLESYGYNNRRVSGFLRIGKIDFFDLISD